MPKFEPFEPFESVDLFTPLPASSTPRSLRAEVARDKLLSFDMLSLALVIPSVVVVALVVGIGDASAPHSSNWCKQRA
jgi:hypothetical protein